ncbi:MAG: DUF4294 domain-containing protein [Salinivirgaceae bacterium]|jgi:hypothetical protein
MMKIIAILAALMSLSFNGFTQQLANDSSKIIGSMIIGVDTLPHINIKEIKVYPKRNFTSKRQLRQYTRLMKNVKKAYPFALIARNELQIMNDSLEHIESEKARKKYIKEYEKEMFYKYEDGLRKLTYSQGKILIKLVYREIGNTSYELVKEYRGDFSATFWQGVARIFGSNLKSTYDPYGEDAEIENIVMMIEDGVI